MKLGSHFEIALLRGTFIISITYFFQCFILNGNTFFFFSLVKLKLIKKTNCRKCLMCSGNSFRSPVPTISIQFRQKPRKSSWKDLQCTFLFHYTFQMRFLFRHDSCGNVILLNFSLLFYHTDVANIWPVLK